MSFNVLIVENEPDWMDILQDQVRVALPDISPIFYPASGYSLAKSLLTVVPFDLLILDIGLGPLGVPLEERIEGVLLLNYVVCKMQKRPAILIVSGHPQLDQLKTKVECDHEGLFHKGALADDKSLCNAIRYIFKKRGYSMTISPVDQFGIGVLLEATKFLFSELGKQVDIWRKKKGENTQPAVVEPVIKANQTTIMLDDIELSVKRNVLQDLREDIANIQSMISNRKVSLRTYEKLATEVTRIEDKSAAEFQIHKLKREIESDSVRLQNMLDRIYSE